MHTLLQKIRPIILALLFLICASVLLAWVSYAIHTYGDSLAGRIQTITNQNAFESQYKELIAAVEETEVERATLEEFILNDDADTIALLSQIDEIAVEQGLELSTSELKVVEEKGKFNSLVLGYAFSGSEEAVDRMIHLFESLPYHGGIQSLSLNRVIEEDGSVGEVEASIALRLSIRKYDQ